MSDLIDSIIDGDDNQSKKSKQDNLNEEYLNDFLTETKEHIENIEMNIIILEKDKNDIETISSVFRDFHTIKGLAGFVAQNLVQKLSHQTESVLDKCRKGDILITDNILKYILESTDYIKSICENLDLNYDKSFLKLISSHLYKYDNMENLENSNEALVNQTAKKNDSILIEKNTDDLINSIIGDDEDSIPKEIEQQKKQSYKEDTVYIRIPIKKIDSLVDMVGELVINHSQFDQQAKSILSKNDKLNINLHRISTITKDIQSLSISLRMVSLKSLFQRIYRIGKDTVSTLGKNVDISIQGDETEIDRGVVEKLVDPMIHLIKNSIYHGIEDVSDRIKLGKPAMGNVKIEAYSKKGFVYIIVSDDGKGIDHDRVYKKALSKNLISPTNDYSNEDILNLLFLPGFSTLDKADNISGRGVGLDVVKTQIAKMGGRVEINNTPGQGCSFIMKMPINMTIIKGTVVEIAGADYIIPTLSIHTVIKPEQKLWVSVKGVKNMVNIQDEIIPAIDIENVLDLKSFDKENCIIVVLESGQKLKALPVTRIIENRDIIVKTLGADFENLNYAFGASILGNGRIAIIFDIENLFQKGE